MIDAGADIIGDPRSPTASPLTPGRRSTMAGSVPASTACRWGSGQPRCRPFYDEGEDFWPKRYAIWGRLVAHQPGQIGYSIIDSKAIGHFMPPVFPGAQANTLPELARQLGLDSERFTQTIADYNAACAPPVRSYPPG